MQERTSRLQQAIVYMLLILGVIGTGFLIYVVIDHLSIDAPVISTRNEPDITPSETAITEPEDSSSVPTGIRIGQRAPAFRLRSLDGDAVSLSDFLGKVVILDFWASWCGPCRLTMPRLEAIAQSLASDVVLLGVSLDQTEQNAANYLTSNNFTAMIALFESYSAAFAVFRAYGNGGIPKTFVIDREGIIRYVGHPGSLPLQTIEGLL